MLNFFSFYYYHLFLYSFNYFIIFVPVWSVGLCGIVGVKIGDGGGGVGWGEVVGGWWVWVGVGGGYRVVVGGGWSGVKDAVGAVGGGVGGVA